MGGRQSFVLLDLLFPPVCLGCGLLLRPQAPPTLPLCLTCAPQHVPLAPGARWSDGIEAVHAYGGPLLRALGRLKFHGQPAWAGPLGAALSVSPTLADPTWDAIVPVPLHPSRLRGQGYNHAALLARHARRRQPWPRPPLRPGWLSRVRATVPQHQLPAPRRRTNVHGAFIAPRPHRVAGRHILLIDDVTTTGATLSVARQALLAAGARRVGALALLRTVA